MSWSASEEFTTLSVLGEGGMGRVVLAVRTEGGLRRLYALKRLRAELVEDEVARESFLDEARLMGLLHHPNVVRVFDVGSDQEGPYMLMEFVHGITLRGLLKQVVQDGLVLPIEVALEILRDASLGLAAAHEACDIRGEPLKLVHRDISPDNVLVGRDGISRLTDFGIAKALGRTTRTTQNLLKGKIGDIATAPTRSHLRR